ncbi:MAG: hypothetical protein E6K78_09670 [Candidatus Eisenbacteria bacterium]|uniref:Uncharacterized protein n=1 Tax=Eiseniibacteriota bacterium TaxID=2212470 RepID=A0A538TKN6_UNCEI|nr:MAG: hypothetical protein E6K78_09670 [Candidatus Eisenbacteria bacterium]
MRSYALAMAFVMLIAAVAWLLRRGAGGDRTLMPVPPALDADDPPEPDRESDGDLELAITSEGVVFVPDSHGVRLLALAGPSGVDAYREDIEAGMIALGAQERLSLAGQRPGSALNAGDFTAARLKRGAAGVLPWRVETLGRDGEFGAFEFETEDGARAALTLLERFRIVRRPLDDEGNPIPASPEDFEEARRRYEDSWRALSLESDLEGGAGGSGIVSDRR